MRISAALSIAATLGSTAAQGTILGFNSGASDDKGNAKNQQDFEREFKAAKSLNGAPGEFNTIRLYSNIQWNTPNTPIAAFPAAIATNTSLLLGIWASGTDNIDNELSALTSALDEHGSQLADLVVGISVGSEDLYRVSEPGLRNNAGVGNDADTIVRFIKDARTRLADTPLKGKPFTHVDTWTAWVNGSNKAVIDEIDFLAVNAFPFYEAERDNQISNAGSLLNSALMATEGVAGGKDVWITETGWAYTGPAFGAAEATVDNAGEYWQEVGCKLFGKRNVFWYTLRDANPDNEVKFAITDNLSTTPRYNLTCPAESEDLPTPAPITNNSTTSTGNGTGSSNETNNDSTASGSPSGSASPSGTGAVQGTGAGSLASVSLVNSMAMALSVVFAMAAWAL
ncbi:GPI-anchored cell wall beta-1,3-endoglucanase EglC [Lizonia empirigonia]|nr:GPI-anchored cell wall beta-1,3-endoglucanase EglC [Lizonia empirigonia]